MALKIAVTGATGRLGSQIAQIVSEHPDYELHSAMNSTHEPQAMLGADVLVDATHYEASVELVQFAISHGLDAVIATSGWNQERIDAMAAELPADRRLLFVPNFSVGSVVASHLAIIAGRYFDSIEIIEAHHEHKVDSPSGTAVRTAEAIAAARNQAPQANFAEQSARGECVSGIPIHSLRLSGVVADQQVLFGGEGEVVTVRHETTSTRAYSQGITLALSRIRSLSGVTIGLDELLGLDTQTGQ